MNQKKLTNENQQNKKRPLKSVKTVHNPNPSSKKWGTTQKKYRRQIKHKECRLGIFFKIMDK